MPGHVHARGQTLTGYGHGSQGLVGRRLREIRKVELFANRETTLLTALLKLHKVRVLHWGPSTEIPDLHLTAVAQTRERGFRQRSRR